MALDKSKPDDFLPDDAQDADQRRDKLIERLQLNWANEDIQEIERIVRKGQEGWAIWRRNSNTLRQL